MQVTLTVVGGVHDGRLIPLRGPEFVIGRDPKCQLRPASSDVSPQHCAVVVRDERAFLRDYGSRSGTLLNGRTLLGGELQLGDGDTIEVGPLKFRVGLVVETPAAAPPTGGTETDDDLVAPTVLSGERGPGETVQVAKPAKPAKPVKKKPGDANEVLCLE